MHAGIIQQQIVGPRYHTFCFWSWGWKIWDDSNTTQCLSSDTEVLSFTHWILNALEVLTVATSLSNLSVFLCNFCTNIGFNLEHTPKPFPLEPPSTNSNNSYIQQLFLSHRACAIRCTCRFQGLYSNHLVVISPLLDSIQSIVREVSLKKWRETCEPGTQGCVKDVPLIVGFYKMHFWSFCRMTGCFWC